MEDNAKDTDSRRLIERAPSLGERFKHLFGIHTWEQRSVEGRTREFCIGCHQERNAVTRFRPPVDFPSQATPSQPSTPEDDSRPFQFPPSEETREARQPGAQDRKAQGDFTAVWQWIVGLRLWVKIMAGFIALQVIMSIVSLFTGGG